MQLSFTALCCKGDYYHGATIKQLDGCIGFGVTTDTTAVYVCHKSSVLQDDHGHVHLTTEPPSLLPSHLPTSICAHVSLMLFCRISLWWSDSEMAPNERCLLEFRSSPSDSPRWIGLTYVCQSALMERNGAAPCPPPGPPSPLPPPTSHLGTIRRMLGQLNFMTPQAWSIQKSPNSGSAEKFWAIIHVYCCFLTPSFVVTCYTAIGDYHLRLFLDAFVCIAVPFYPHCFSSSFLVPFLLL